MDPLAEKYPSWSPYNYVLNNPVGMVDPDGMDAEGSRESTVAIWSNWGIKLSDRWYGTAFFDPSDGKFLGSSAKDPSTIYFINGEEYNKGRYHKATAFGKIDLSEEYYKTGAQLTISASIAFKVYEYFYYRYQIGREIISYAGYDRRMGVVLSTPRQEQSGSIFSIQLGEDSYNTSAYSIIASLVHEHDHHENFLNSPFMNYALHEVRAREAVVKHWIWELLSQADQADLISSYNAYLYSFRGRNKTEYRYPDATSMIRSLGKKIK